MSDHNDGPRSIDDPAADLTDLFTKETSMHRGRRLLHTARFEPLRVMVAVAAAVPTAAFAHPGHGGAQELWQGFMHPLGGLDHVLAALAVGVIAARLGGRALWAVPFSFIATMALAGAIAMGGVVLPGSETGIALSVIVLGAVIALSIQLPVTVATATVVAIAVFHGYAHGLEMGPAKSGIPFGMGFVLATALLQLAGIRAGRALNRVEATRARRLA